MADLAVSLAKTVVQGALTKALSAIEEEATLRASTQNDLVFITGEFQMMQSFLNVADEERVSNNVVSTWVRQVRDLAYNVEDCIEYVIHLDKKSDWCCRCLILCLPVPRSMKPQLPLDKAVAEIKQLKARVEDVSHRNMRYNLISDSGSKPATQQQLVPGASVESATFDMQFQARDTKTLQGGFGDLTKLLTTKKPGDDLGVISVWAAGGNPDTTPIIREAYADREICANFGCRGWAKLTHPFNPHEFRRSLLIQFHTNSFKQIEPSGGVSILQRLETAAQGELVQDFIKKMEERYLVVLENISSMVDWDTVRAYLPEGKKGSWTVVTTQQAEVARLCVGDPWQALELKQHSAEHSAFVFVREVDKLDGVSALSDSQDPELRKLISRCGGLPKVIVAMANFLAPMTVNWMNNAVNLSSTFMHDLNTKPEFDNLRGLFGWMHSYFCTCPDYLKPCILYLSIFPQGQSIRRRRLVRRWIAEGYCRDTNDTSAEDNGEKFLSLLLDLSILQKTPHSITTSGTRMVSCQVNSFFREYIICRQKDEDLVFELEGRCTLTTQRTGRHLVLKESWDRDQIVFDSIDFSGLRSLTVFGNWKPFFITESMKVLRVLDLENAKGVTYQHLEQKLRLLPRLKFLSLRGIREISHLPCSFRDLRQLETLDIWGTSIVSLPQSITKLTKLQYIRAGRAKQSSISHLFSLPGPRRACPMGGVEVPAGIEKLTALHTLGDVNVSLEGCNAILKEVKKLTQLHKVGVTGISNKNRLEFWSAISYQVHLESLSVWLSKGSEHCLDDLSLPQKMAAEDKAKKKPQQKDQEEPQQMDQERHLENLRSLKLYGLSEKVPSWIKYLPKLTKLDLHMTISKKDDINEVLSEMEELLILRLHVDLLQDEVGELDFCVMYSGVEKRCYEKVKMLHISCSSDFNVSFGSESLPNLELLTARCCSGSALLMFAELNNLSKQKLKEVRYSGSLEDILKEELEKQLKKHPKEPSLKLELS